MIHPWRLVMHMLNACLLYWIAEDNLQLDSPDGPMYIHETPCWAAARQSLPLVGITYYLLGSEELRGLGRSVGPGRSDQVFSCRKASAVSQFDPGS